VNQLVEALRRILLLALYFRTEADAPPTRFWVFFGFPPTKIYRRPAMMRSRASSLSASAESPPDSMAAASLHHFLNCPSSYSFLPSNRTPKSLIAIAFFSAQAKIAVGEYHFSTVTVEQVGEHHTIDAPADSHQHTLVLQRF